MTRLHFKLSQISLALALAFGALMFSACEDMSKAPLIDGQINPMFGLIIKFQSQDDTTIINKITISGKDGVCEVDEYFGAGGDFMGADKVLYGEVIPFDNARIVELNPKTCSPKNGKYKVEVATNLGTYTYDLKFE